MDILETYETFRGDTIYKEISIEDYKFKNEDIIKVAVIDNLTSETLFDTENIFSEEKEAYELYIYPEKTKKFPIRQLLLEIEVTLNKNFVKTFQYILDVKEDGIL